MKIKKSLPHPLAVMGVMFFGLLAWAGYGEKVLFSWGEDTMGIGKSLPLLNPLIHWMDSLGNIGGSLYFIFCAVFIIGAGAAFFTPWVLYTKYYSKTNEKSE
jgi:hypothetical protein